MPSSAPRGPSGQQDVFRDWIPLTARRPIRGSPSVTIYDSFACTGLRCQRRSPRSREQEAPDRQVCRESRTRVALKQFVLASHQSQLGQPPVLPGTERRAIGACLLNQSDAEENSFDNDQCLYLSCLPKQRFPGQSRVEMHVERFRLHR